MTSKSSTKKAVALQYERGRDSAPKVLASGRGLIAERILQIAVECGVPQYEDPLLTDALRQLELDDEIPPALYQAVAEALAFVYRMNERL